MIIPFRCTALGCKFSAEANKPFCIEHWHRVPPMLKGEIVKQSTGADYTKKTFSKLYQAAVYRAQTKLGIRDRRIPPELADRREYFVKTNFLGMTRAQILDQA